MADYFAFPLWAEPDEGPVTEGGYWFGNLSPGDLPLSDSLVAELQEWAEMHDRLLGPEFRWPSPQAKAGFVAEGRQLVVLVREELGPGYEVGYFDESTGRVEYE